MVTEVYKETKMRMKKVVEAMQADFFSIRTGRASVALLDRIRVDYYGSHLPINQIASLGVPEPRLILIQPWDKGALPAIERAILTSDLGLTPSSDGNVIRVPIPPLTEDRRKELQRLVKKRAEEAKIGIRNVRRDSNNEIKGLERDGEISEDDSRKAMEEIQKITNDFIKEIDTILKRKEEEIFKF